MSSDSKGEFARHLLEQCLDGCESREEHIAATIHSVRKAEEVFE